jgi:pimeloyl-ACP methyl ester carboxylesterase
MTTYLKTCKYRGNDLYLAKKNIGRKHMSKKLVTSVLSLALAMTMVSAVANAESVSKASGVLHGNHCNHIQEGLIDMGGYKMFIDVQGERKHGSPTIVLDSGNGNSSDIWSKVAPSLAQETRVVTYDRIKLGKSDAPTGVDMSAEGQVTRLHTLLKKANVRGPIVLVSHSIAGQYARVYQAKYPDQVKGIVFVDSSYEHQQNSLFVEFDAATRQAILDGDLKNGGPEYIEGSYQDLLSTFAQVDAADATGRIAHLPITVLSGGNHGYPPIFGNGDTRLEDRWAANQALIAGLSDNSVHVTDPNNGHYLHTQNPTLVINQTLALLDRIKDVD